MSRMQKALEKAEKDRSRTRIGKKNQETVPAEKTKPLIHDTEESPHLSPRINYRQSKVTGLDKGTLRKNRLISYFDGNIVSDQYKIIKTKILQKTRKEGLNAIIITSTFRGEGKSLTAGNLAISLSKEVAHTVLLVDADLRKPSLHQLFGIRPDAGLSDYITRGIPLPDLLINPGINRLLLLPGRAGIEDSAEAVGAPAMERLVQELKTRYPERYVIFDSPPLLEGADSLVLSKYVDGVILVIESGKTQRPHLEKALGLLKDRNLLGLILNKGEIYEKKKYYRYYSYPSIKPESRKEKLASFIKAIK